jgi:uridine kinase
VSAAPTPLLIGVAGGTGSGKSTVAQALAGGLPAGTCVVLDHDSYYKDRSDLDVDERRRLNFDHPAALDNDLLVDHLTALRSGRGVDVPLYDFVRHARRAETRRAGGASRRSASSTTPPCGRCTRSTSSRRSAGPT